MEFSPYKDPEYRQAKAWLKANPAPCWECGRPATTPDHFPPLAQHQHRRGAGCCTFRPHCRRCSSRQGGTMSPPPARIALGDWFG